MGLIAEQTPEMGEYGVEVRRESFYLRAEPGRHGIYVYQHSDDEWGTVELLIEDIPKIRAALDQVERLASR